MLAVFSSFTRLIFTNDNKSFEFLNQEEFIEVEQLEMSEMVELVLGGRIVSLRDYFVQIEPF